MYSTSSKVYLNWNAYTYTSSIFVHKAQIPLATILRSNSHFISNLYPAEIGFWLGHDFLSSKKFVILRLTHYVLC